jgi:hypothetical protein
MTEAEAYDDILQSHLNKIITRARTMSEDQWLWSPAPCAPTTAALVNHAWTWLVSDRLQILDQNVKVFCPEHAPASKDALVDALEIEAGEWNKMLTSMTSTYMDESRKNFGVQDIDVRRLIAHMVQNVIYKSGQVSANFFALGLDGTEPYTAPFPKDVVEYLRKQQESAMGAGTPG